METTIYSAASGKEAGKIALPENIFGLPANQDLVHQVVMAMQANARTSTAHTKDRSEVSGGGKKPWKQKGLGRARAGSSRSPIWVKGGVTFGPRNEKDYSQKINKKMKVKALFTALSQKLRDGQILFVDAVDLSAIKTKDAQGILNNLAKVEGFKTLNTKKSNNVYFALPKNDAVAKKSFGNIYHVHLDELRNLNPVDVLTYRYLVIAAPQESVELLAQKLNK